MYLVHYTTGRNLRSILEKGFLYSQNEMVLNKIKPQDGFGMFINEFDPYIDTYQGVYMRLITKSMVNDSFEKLDDDFMLVFNINLLFEDNKYHFNSEDIFGVINEQTYFPEDLETILSLDLTSHANEVVFHHKIDLKHTEMIISLKKPCFSSHINICQYDKYPNLVFNSQGRSKNHLKKCKNLVRVTPQTAIFRKGCTYLAFIEQYNHFKPLYMNEWNEIVLKDCSCDGCKN